MDVTKSGPFTFKDNFIYGLVWVFGACWAAPFTVLGALLCVTVIGIPIGLPLMWIGVWPLRKLIEARANKRDEWRKETAYSVTSTTDTTLVIRPWEDDALIASYDDTTPPWV